MLPEHLQTTSVDGGPLKPQHNDDTINYPITTAADLTIGNGGDNIITISTAGIADHNSHTLDAHIEDAETATPITNISIKSNKIHTTSEKIVQFLRKQKPQSRTTTTTAAATAATHNSTHTQIGNETAASHSNVAVQRRRHCNVSQCISFQDNIAELQHRKGRRLNGLQLPLHPLQVFGWLVLILFGIASFWILIPSFVVEIQGPLYGLISGLYIVHVISHIAALLIDPADRELRRVHRNDRIVPEFDRSKHVHVIENGRCHLCNIRTTSQRTKHCSVCNKCVGKFDHHCKWLNHCVGSRNYVAFLMCVVSAVIATLVIVAAVVAQIVLYYVQPEWLSFWYLKGGGYIYASSTITTTSASTAGGTDLLDFTNISNSNNTNSSNNNELLHNVAADLDLFAVNATDDEAFLLQNDNNFVSFANGTTAEFFDNLTTLLTDSVDNLSTTITSYAESVAPPIATAADNNNIFSNGNNGTQSHATLAGIGISDTIFLIFIGALGLVAAITAGLLLHLCFFHIYISFLGLTTYEYIRNHRQAQEAKAKNALSMLPKNGQNNQLQHDHTHSTNPSKKTTDCGQIYFCSSLRNPNAIDRADMRYFETSHRSVSSNADDAAEKATALHCCANSREYHQTALKTYYMCSLLEEGPPTTVPTLGVAHISGGAANAANLYHNYHHDDDESSGSDDFKTFHCCSTFAASTTHRKVSAATTKATLVSDLEATAAALSARHSYLQFTEQCTFCTFRIRSPIVAKRSSASVSNHSNAIGRQQSSAYRTDSNKPAAASVSSNGTSVEHQRCCMKTISKHQRWRRKWNCCSSVPDSPDVPTNDLIAALAMRHQQHTTATTASTIQTINASEIPVHAIKAVNGNGSFATTTRPTSPRSANLKAQTRATRNARTWPVARFRHVMRMLGRYRRPRCHHNVRLASADEQIKQNQIRPMHLQTANNSANICQHRHYYDSSSPQPPSTTTPSERSSDPSLYSDSSTMTTPTQPAQPNTIETILPTSVIRDDTSMTYTTPICITLPPALPPPTRRKMPNSADLAELAETLTFAAASNGNYAPTQRLPALSNVYRRQRRKHFLRTRSPTLSPIHESGLSNPTSPQPCRHNATSTSCSPASATAAAVVNNLCGSSELLRKTASNNSLHSVSSNSSST